VVSIDALRSDEVENCPEAQKEVIRGNFPGERNGYLVVPKVIED
jgi:Asp-tRNA(Asn)/Glu-tRNA(Gln) amidotransferase C subunit